MKNRFIITLLCAATTACAENLPPVVSTVAPSEVNKPAGPSVSTVNEMMNRIDQMQKEIQQLTGKVEDQVFLIAELKKQQKTMYTDFDERLTVLENKSGGAAAPASDLTEPSAPDSEAAKSDAEAKSTEPTEATTDSATTDAAMPAASAASSESDDSVTTPKAKAKPEPQPETPIEASAEEKQEYQAAYNQLRTGHTDESITAFDAYLLKYPNGGYASNVQYWLGEAYRVKQDNEAAKAAFNKVVDNYPSSTKVPDALLKLGYIEVEQNNPSKATDYFNRIITDYPSSNAAYLASKKLASLADKAAP